MIELIEHQCNENRNKTDVPSESRYLQPRRSKKKHAQVHRHRLGDSFQEDQSPKAQYVQCDNCGIAERTSISFQKSLPRVSTACSRMPSDFFLSGGIRPLENVALKKKKGGKLNPRGRSSSPF